MAVIYNFKYAKSEEIKLEKQAQNKKLEFGVALFELPKRLPKKELRNKIRPRANLCPRANKIAVLLFFDVFFLFILAIYCCYFSF